MMGEAFNAYGPLHQMVFSSMALSQSGVTLVFNNENQRNSAIELSSMADICCNIKNLFKPASETEICRANDVAEIYKLLGQRVTEFKPLSMNRACCLEFGEQKVFVWAETDSLPDCLFMAQRKIKSVQTEWWLIDDQ